MIKSILSILLPFFLFSSCTEIPTNVKTVNALPDIYPDYIRVTIPSCIAPLNFNVVSAGLECVDVTVRGERGNMLHSKGKWAKFDIDNWHRLLDMNKGGTLKVSVSAKIKGQWYQYESFDIYVSSYPLSEWGVTYRRIAPGYEVYSTLGIYQRDLSTFDEYTIIDNKDTHGMCLNCHTSNKTNPQNFVFHVRGNHGATVMQYDDRRESLKASNDALGGAMVYPYWHPSGKFCAFSTNQTHQAFHIGMDKRIEVFDQASDIIIYNPKTHEIIKDSLLATKEWSENCPVFSPDGRKLYFITALQQEYPLHYKDQKYSLCSIDFDAKDGTFGNSVDTLFNAASMGKSVTWPRPSYDGKFMIFTLLDYGYFSIWHKESEQWLLNMETNEARAIEEINSDDADSYHNWSSNSRWIVFTSRRENGLYSQLYISSIDENGKATKPFLLPQKNPLEYYDETLFSFNTPDFTSKKVVLDYNEVMNELSSDIRVSTTIK